MNKSFLLPIVAVAAAGAVAVTSATAYAQAATNSGGPYPPLVTRIAEKFGLNVDDVQAVFDEDRETRHAERQRELEDRLNQAVAAGGLTEEQKQLILSEHAELHAKMEALRENTLNLSREDRRAAMERQRAELQSWAKENGIDESYMMMKMGGQGRGDGMMHMREE